MTAYSEIYDAFTAKILDDEWESWEAEEVTQDMRAILESAIPHFKFPKISLERNNNGFVNTLSSNEIQILASFMKIEWLNRTILSYRNLKTLYSESDFSQANLIDKLKELLIEERESVKVLEGNYYRSDSGKPFNYKVLSGGN